MKLPQAFKPKPSKIMNETLPPSLGVTSQPKTSALAIWSLVLGILGLVLLMACLGVLFAIPGVICGHLAYSRIKRSSGALAGQGMALAGLITGYVSIGLSVFILPMLMAIAIPNFVKARATSQANACINNLRQIDAAANEFALEHGKTNGETINFPDDLTPYIKLNQQGKIPSCPAGGTYSIKRVGEAPTCSLGTTVTPAHVLPP
jgi:competence protein ComGC